MSLFVLCSNLTFCLVRFACISFFTVTTLCFLQILDILQQIKAAGPPRLQLIKGTNAHMYRKAKTVHAYRSRDPVTIFKDWVNIFVVLFVHSLVITFVLLLLVFMLLFYYNTLAFILVRYSLVGSVACILFVHRVPI